MKRYLTFFLATILLLSPIYSFAQTNKGTEQVFQKVDQMPEFLGDLNLYLSSNIYYPKEAYYAKIEGRVMISFVVNEDGTISDVRVIKGIGGGCDEEAKRVVEEMPEWKPGKQNGKAVKVRYTLPVRFVLDTSPIRQEQKQEQKFTYVDQMPVFKEGSLNEFLSKNIYYPDSARMKNIEGRVVTSFVVNEDGSISDIQIVRGIGGGCDEEAVRVIKAMPKWKPGKQNGEAVKVRFTLPILFKLDHEEDSKK